MTAGQVRVHRMFFDRAAVMAAADRMTLRGLGKAGGYARKVARNSIKPRKRPSQPGQPPSSHTGLLKGGGGRAGGILYGYDPGGRSVVVGPVALNWLHADRRGRLQTGLIPETLEFGGSYRVLEWLRGGRWQRADLRSRRRFDGRQTRWRAVAIAARPYMRPAFAATRDRLPLFFRNTFTASAA